MSIAFIAERGSLRPAKQLLWRWLERDMQESSSCRAGLDIACGAMINRPLFRTQTYTGIDLDRGRIEEGLTKYPNVRGEVCDILNMLEDVQGDFVLCIQTIGINAKCDPVMDVAMVEAIVDRVNSGGTLIVNLGPACQDQTVLIDILRQRFDGVIIRPYGRLNGQVPNVLISKFLCIVMDYLPSALLRGAGFVYLIGKQKKNRCYPEN